MQIVQTVNCLGKMQIGFQFTKLVPTIIGVFGMFHTLAPFI